MVNDSINARSKLHGSVIFYFTLTFVNNCTCVKKEFIASTHRCLRRDLLHHASFHKDSALFPTFDCKL